MSPSPPPCPVSWLNRCRLLSQTVCTAPIALCHDTHIPLSVNRCFFPHGITLFSCGVFTYNEMNVLKVRIIEKMFGT